MGHGTSLEHLVHYHHMKSNNDERIQAMTYGDFVEAKASKDYEFEEFNTSIAKDHPSYIKYQLRPLMQ